MGVTGVRSEITTDIGAMVRIIRENTRKPCAVGFGISTPQQARDMAQCADGVIVGSAIVKLAAQFGKDAAKQLPTYDLHKQPKFSGSSYVYMQILLCRQMYAVYGIYCKSSAVNM